MAMIFVFCFINIFYSGLSEILWTDPLDSLNGGNNITWITGSNPTGSLTAPYTTTPTDCPNAAYCWQLQENYFVYYIHPTSNYQNITLTISISASNLEVGFTSDSCNIYYSTDGSTNWGSPLMTWNANDIFPILSHTISLPLNAANNIGIGIKLQSESMVGNKNDFCYFSDIIFRGHIIDTIQPTAMPTIHPSISRISATPHPVTAISSSTSLTTSTSTNTTTDILAGNNAQTSKNNSAAQFGLFGGITAGILVIIIIFFIVICKRKSKKAKETIAAQAAQQQVQQSITAQYMDAYRNGGASTRQSTTRQMPSTPKTEPFNASGNNDHDHMYVTTLKPGNEANNEHELPIDIRQLFGAPQSEIQQDDSDDDSIMKKQKYYSEREGNEGNQHND